MNTILLEKMDAFLRDATPESILANCKKYGCVVEDIKDSCPSNSLNEKSFETDMISEYLWKFKNDTSFKSEERKNQNYALAA